MWNVAAHPAPDLAQNYGNPCGYGTLLARGSYERRKREVQDPPGPGV